MLTNRQTAATQAIRVGATATIALALLTGAAASAGAAETSTATCRWSGPVSINPGLTAAEVTRAALVTEGGHSLDCHGSVNGHEITGPGTYADDKPTIEGSCGTGSGSATMVATLPTAAGPQTLRVPYSYRYGPLSGFKSSGGGAWAGPIPLETGSDKATWAFALYPLEGDCVTRPVTRVAVEMAGVFRT